MIQKLCDAEQGRTRVGIWGNSFLSSGEDGQYSFDTPHELARFLSHLNATQIDRAIAAIETGNSGLENREGDACLISLYNLRSRLGGMQQDIWRALQSVKPVSAQPVVLAPAPVILSTASSRQPLVPVSVRSTAPEERTISSNLDNGYQSKLTAFFRESRFTTAVVKREATIIVDALKDTKITPSFGVVRPLIDRLIWDTPPTRAGVRDIQRKLEVTDDGRIGKDTVRALLLRAGIREAQIPETFRDLHKTDWRKQPKASIAVKWSKSDKVIKKPAIEVPVSSALTEGKKLDNYEPQVLRAIVSAWGDSLLRKYNGNGNFFFGTSESSIDYAVIKFSDNSSLIYDKPDSSGASRRVYKKDNQWNLVWVIMVSSDNKTITLVAWSRFNARYQPEILVRVIE